MAYIASEMLWVHFLLQDIGVDVSVPMKMFNDNQAMLFIASNPVFNQRTKHIEIDCYFIRDQLQKK